MKQSNYSMEAAGISVAKKVGHLDWLRQRIKVMGIVRVAIAGFGGVGRAIADVLLSRRNRYRKVYGVDLRLVAVCGARSGLSDPGGLEFKRLDTLEEGLSGPDFIEVSGADILIEAGPSDFRTGGPGLAYIRSFLSKGRDAIVISKGALAHSGPELRSLADNSGAILKISGAAAAALPTMDLLNYSLKGCEVREIEGILNATTNYILDAMMDQELDFNQALICAQAGGFAEADPRNDTEGWDTAAKLLIIANFGLGAQLRMDDLSVEGIQSVTVKHIASWRSEGVVPKLVGHLTNVNGELRASIAIRTYSVSHPFAKVSGKNKAIRITTDAMGETIAIGSGTEPLATAAAALKDLEHILDARVTQSAPFHGISS